MPSDTFPPSSYKGNAARLWAEALRLLAAKSAPFSASPPRGSTTVPNPTEQKTVSGTADKTDIKDAKEGAA